MSEAKFRLLGSTAPQRAACAHAKQQTRTKKKRVRDRRFLIGEPLMDDQVLTFREWCALNGIGLRTGRRILDGPNPPAVAAFRAPDRDHRQSQPRMAAIALAPDTGGRAMTGILFVIVVGVTVAAAVDVIVLAAWVWRNRP